MQQLFMLIFIITTLLFSSCDKRYSCVCKTIISNQDTIVEAVETTKLGSKGFKTTCTNHEVSNSNLKDCHIQ